MACARAEVEANEEIALGIGLGIVAANDFK